MKHLVDKRSNVERKALGLATNLYLSLSGPYSDGSKHYDAFRAVEYQARTDHDGDGRDSFEPIPGIELIHGPKSWQRVLHEVEEMARAIYDTLDECLSSAAIGLNQRRREGNLRPMQSFDFETLDFEDLSHLGLEIAAYREFSGKVHGYLSAFWAGQPELPDQRYGDAIREGFVTGQSVVDVLQQCIELDGQIAPIVKRNADVVMKAQDLWKEVRADSGPSEPVAKAFIQAFREIPEDDLEQFASVVRLMPKVLEDETFMPVTADLRCLPGIFLQAVEGLNAVHCHKLSRAS